MKQLPSPQDPEQIREWDRKAIEEYGVPGVVLMENAGGGAARILLDLSRRRPEEYPQLWIILCGPGNNGGDDFVVARHLHNAGHSVEVHLAFDPARLEPAGDNTINHDILKKTRVPLFSSPAPFPPPDILGGGRPCTIVDALLGTGLSRPLRPPYLEWVRATHGSRARVIALDLPTGLDASSGEILGDVVRAAHTITFAAPKRGFELGKGPEVVGEVHVVDIGMPREIWSPVT